MTIFLCSAHGLGNYGQKGWDGGECIGVCQSPLVSGLQVGCFFVQYVKVGELGPRFSLPRYGQYGSVGIVMFLAMWNPILLMQRILFNFALPGGSNTMDMVLMIL